MKKSNRFAVPRLWKTLLDSMQVDPQLLAADKNFPVRALVDSDTGLRSDHYVRFWQIAASVAGGRGFPHRIAAHLSLDQFDSSVFAFMCSGHPLAALNRLSAFRAQTSPFGLSLSEDGDAVVLGFDGTHASCPAVSLLCEMTIVIRLLQLASDDSIRPVKVEMSEPPSSYDGLEPIFRCPVVQGSQARVWFDSRTMQQPFTADVEGMWHFFEGKFIRLQDLGSGASYADRLRAVLLELMPAGRFAMEQLAVDLNSSKRTIQRRLNEEGERYQELLQKLRLQLADHYLIRSSIGLADIAQLLGFANRQSFVRAYAIWTGRQPRATRRASRPFSQANS
jgi:AraC-like DNA-binding protein